MAHPVSVKHNRLIKKAQKEVIKSKNSEFLWNVNNNCLRRSSLRLMQIHSDGTATSLKCNALAGYLGLVVCLILTTRREPYLIDPGHTFFGLRPANSADWEAESRQWSADKAFLQYGFASLEVVPLKKIVFDYIFDDQPEKAGHCARRGNPFHFGTVAKLL